MAPQNPPPPWPAFSPHPSFPADAAASYTRKRSKTPAQVPGLPAPQPPVLPCVFALTSSLPLCWATRPSSGGGGALLPCPLPPQATAASITSSWGNSEHTGMGLLPRFTHTGLSESLPFLLKGACLPHYLTAQRLHQVPCPASLLPPPSPSSQPAI